jgi:hypothetical protein
VDVAIDALRELFMPAGPKSPYQAAAANPGSDCATVGTFGNSSDHFSELMPSMRTAPDLASAPVVASEKKPKVMWPAARSFDPAFQFRIVLGDMMLQDARLTRGEHAGRFDNILQAIRDAREGIGVTSHEPLLRLPRAN